MNQVVLKSVGSVPAVRVTELKENDVVLWNFGKASKVVGFKKEKETDCYMTVMFEDLASRSEVERRFRKNTLVGLSTIKEANEVDIDVAEEHHETIAQQVIAERLEMINDKLCEIPCTVENHSKILKLIQEKSILLMPTRNVGVYNRVKSKLNVSAESVELGDLIDGDGFVGKVDKIEYIPAIIAKTGKMEYRFFVTYEGGNLKNFMKHRHEHKGDLPYFDHRAVIHGTKMEDVVKITLK